jgi:hypothetical protein
LKDELTELRYPQYLSSTLRFGTELVKTGPIVQNTLFKSKPEPWGTDKNIDVRDQPAYTLAESARYLKVASATLRSWVVGRPYPKAVGVGQFRPLIHPPPRRPPVLSFWNLIEAHVLRSLRTEHGVSLKALRQGVTYAEKSLNVDRLLLRRELRTEAGQLFLGRYGELINLSASGQLAMRRVFDEHLKRVEWDE